MNTQLFQGDCLQVMRDIPDNSVDSIVTDPPYGLSFMGKKWDYDVPAVAIWAEALRVLKPGGHLLSFAGSRTYHRMTVNIEDAGFEIRDQIMWVYGSGFPKSHNLKDDWQGWGTALKPAHEPICVARKPPTGTVAANVLEWGTGGLNVDGCRIGDELIKSNGEGANGWPASEHTGRWPANFIHDGIETEWARYFYCAKASKRDRDEGCEGLEERQYSHDGRTTLIENAYQRNDSKARNHHPTVKPTNLMCYLVRLVTPPNGVVLDPFMGSGSTGKAAMLEGFSFIGIEMSDEYLQIAKARIEKARGNQ